jgi:hypothetical protein
MNEQIHEFTLGPHNHVVEVAGFAKAAAKTSSSQDERTLTSYIAQLGDPDTPDEDYGNADALADSHQLGAHLALAKIGEMQCNHDKVGKHLDQALAYHSKLHSGIHAAAQASETNPMRIREEQEAD